MSPHVLIVEDDEVIARIVAETLQESGYSVESAGNGQAALALLAPRRRSDNDRLPDLILLDMWMPVMDGWQFAAAYRALPGPHAPLVVMTAGASAARAAAEIGAVGTLPKPYTLEELGSVVAAICGAGGSAPAP